MIGPYKWALWALGLQHSLLVFGLLNTILAYIKYLETREVEIDVKKGRRELGRGNRGTMIEREIYLGRDRGQRERDI